MLQSEELKGVWSFAALSKGRQMLRVTVVTLNKTKCTFWGSELMHLCLPWHLLSVPTCRCSWSCTCSGERDSSACLYPRRSRRERWFVACVRHRRSGRRPDRSRTASRSCIWLEPLFSGRQTEVRHTSTFWDLQHSEQKWTQSLRI